MKINGGKSVFKVIKMRRIDMVRGRRDQDTNNIGMKKR